MADSFGNLVKVYQILSFLLLHESPICGFGQTVEKKEVQNL
jgi:hypothetical protein